MAHQLFRRARFLGVLTAVILSLNLVTSAQAADFDSVSIGTFDSCTLEDWIATGTVQAVVLPKAGVSNNCAADIYSIATDNTEAVTSTLRKTFPSMDGFLKFNIHTSSSNINNDKIIQTVTLYSSDSSNSRNSSKKSVINPTSKPKEFIANSNNGDFRFTADLTDYPNMQLTLEIKTTILPDSITYYSKSPLKAKKFTDSELPSQPETKSVHVFLDDVFITSNIIWPTCWGCKL